METATPKLKHIHLKFLNQVNFTTEPGEKSFGDKIGEIKFPPHDFTMSNIPDGMIPYFFGDHFFCSALKLDVNGVRRIIPEPDVVLVYYSTAYFNYKRLDEQKNIVIAKTEKIIGEPPPIEDLFVYMGTVSCVVIFLFTALEATMNRCIPDDYVKTHEGLTRTETVNKEQVERGYPFDRKLKLINELTGKSFKDTYEEKYNQILKLKEFRDDIIHSKSVNEGDDASNHNFRKAFVFDFTSAMFAVREFCNFYLNKELIVNCPCGKDT